MGQSSGTVFDACFLYRPHSAVGSKVTKESHRRSYGVMVGDREKTWLPVNLHVPNEFTIMLSRENIVDSFFLSRAVEGT